MLIGAMNHPGRPLGGELRRVAELGLDFVDLTLEPPAAGVWQVDLEQVRKLLRDFGLGIVGHTAPNLPMAHPFEAVRRGAVVEFVRCAEAFAELGAAWMTVHPNVSVPMHDRDFVVARNLQSLEEIVASCRRVGIGLMVENLPGGFNTAAELGELLEAMPDLGLHLDVGHTNLQVAANTTAEILAAWSPRLRHVHLHDNLGGRDDLHLPLGAGTLDDAAAVQALKRVGYDHTITLEIHSEDKSLVRQSADRLRRLWSGI